MILSLGNTTNQEETCLCKHNSVDMDNVFQYTEDEVRTSTTYTLLIHLKSEL